jgi:hypothetical protein
MDTRALLSLSFSKWSLPSYVSRELTQEANGQEENAVCYQTNHQILLVRKQGFSKPQSAFISHVFHEISLFPNKNECLGLI